MYEELNAKKLIEESRELRRQAQRKEKLATALDFQEAAHSHLSAAAKLLREVDELAPLAFNEVSAVAKRGIECDKAHVEIRKIAAPRIGSAAADLIADLILSKTFPRTV